MMKIEDAEVVATSGKTHHPIVAFTGRDTDTVAGTSSRSPQRSSENADKYEVAAYKRIGAILRSGARAWVYVDARYAPPS